MIVSEDRSRLAGLRSPTRRTVVRATRRAVARMGE